MTLSCNYVIMHCYICTIKKVNAFYNLKNSSCVFLFVFGGHVCVTTEVTVHLVEVKCIIHLNLLSITDKYMILS